MPRVRSVRTAATHMKKRSFDAAFEVSKIVLRIIRTEFGTEIHITRWSYAYDHRVIYVSIRLARLS